MDSFQTDIPIWEIVFRSVFVFGFLLVLLRISGKRDVGEMSPADLIMLLLLTANVHTSLSGSDKSLIGGVIGATALFGANYCLNYMAFKNKRFEKTLKGSPEVIIYEGKVCQDILKRHLLTHAHLKIAVRAEGLYRIKDVRLAVLEPDGTISILKRKT